jgi:hypothetical protein
MNEYSINESSFDGTKKALASYKKIKIPEQTDWKKFHKQGQYPRKTKNYYRFRQADPSLFSKFMWVSQGKRKFVIGKRKDTGKWEIQSVILSITSNLSQEKWIPRQILDQI